MNRSFLALRPLFLVTALCTLHSSVQASDGGPAFIENRGQVVDQNGLPRPDVLFLAPCPGMNVQLRRTGFSYDVIDYDKPIQAEAFADGPLVAAAPTARVHRVDVDFVNASADFTVRRSEAEGTALNFFTTGTPESGVLGVHQYHRVLYADVWPHVDIEFVAQENGMKWNVVVRPGGDLSSVALRFGGAEPRIDREGALQCTWSDGSVVERIPESHFITDRQRHKATAAWAMRHANTVGLLCNTRAPQGATLIIDPVPTRLWGTYFTVGTFFNSVDHATDASGNTYLTGNTGGTATLATSGAYDTVLDGFLDAFIAKFNSSGVRIWCTYYGGDGDEFANAAAVSAVTSSVAICGRTNSANAMATIGAHQFAFGGSQDGFIALFNSNGSRTWGTYYGGSGSDEATDIVFDAAGAPFVTGSTNSSSGIASAGSYDPTYNGLSDGFLVKLSATCIRQWATYYGGTSNETPEAITCDNAWIFVCGQTSSTTGIATAGAHDVTLTGSVDAFLMKFANNGIRSWGTYYGGSGITDWGMDCLAEIGTGYVYLAGKTKSIDAIATPGAYQETPGMNFLARFNSACVRQWGTYLNGEQEMALARGSANEAYVAGISQDPNGIASPDGYDVSQNGGADVYLMKFSTAGGRVWGTYYGGTESDRLGGLSAVNGLLWFSGTTQSTSGIATAGAFQSTFGGAGDPFLVKFSDVASGMALEPFTDHPAFRVQVTNDRRLVVQADPVSAEGDGCGYSMYDANSRLVRSGTLGANGNTIALDGLVTGIYTVQLRSGERTTSTRILIP